MIKNPYNWTASDVAQWLSVIQCSNAREIFLFHGIEGKDLLQLSDADLRFDLQFRRIHDRKYILRKIQDLRNFATTTVEIRYGDRVCRIRVADIHAYTFDMLRKDAARYFKIIEEESVILDSHGFPWGSVPIGCLFDSNLKQLEAVYLEDNRSEERKQSRLITEGDQEDFNEDNPFHEYKERYSSLLAESQIRLSPINTPVSNLELGKDSSSLSKQASISHDRSSDLSLSPSFRSRTPNDPCIPGSIL
jgi:hypothetical protein